MTSSSPYVTPNLNITSSSPKKYHLQTISSINVNLATTLDCINISVRSTCSEISTPSQLLLHLCIVNVQSIKNKSAEFVDYVTSCKADLFALTETWLSKNDNARRAEITSLVLGLLIIHEIIIMEEELHFYSEKI